MVHHEDQEVRHPLAVVGMLAVGTSAWAGTSFQSYRTTVGKFNGNGYTAYQTKSGAGTAAYRFCRLVHAPE